MTGEVKSYSPQHGYGFITSNGEDYFFHSKQWDFRTPILVGTRVEFEPDATCKRARVGKIRRKTYGK